MDVNHIGIEILRITHTEQARHRADNHHVATPRQQGGSSGQTKLLNLIVNHQILLDIFVDRRDIRLRLVIIVI